MVPLELVVEDAGKGDLERGGTDGQGLVERESSGLALLVVVDLSRGESLVARLELDAADLELDRVEHDLSGFLEHLDGHLFLTTTRRMHH